MLHARFVTAQGSLHYFAPTATPYDFDVLRDHVRNQLRVPSDIPPRLELTVEDGTLVPARWLREVSNSGVRVSRVRSA